MSIKLYTGEEEFVADQKGGFCESVVTEMIQYETPEMEYSMRKVPIGYYKSSTDVFTLDFSKSKRILVLGKTGAGKTVLSSTIIDRCAKSGMVTTIFDLKGEYVHKNEPLQNSFASKTFVNEDGEDVPLYFFRQERPQGFSISVYSPIFLRKLLRTKRSLGRDERYCQFGMESITKTDFMILFDTITKVSPRYYDILEELWNGITQQGLYSWDEIISYIDESDSFDKLSSRAIIRRLKNLKESKVIGDFYDPPEMVEDVQQGKVGVMNLKGMLELPDAVSPAHVYVNIMLRRIYNAKVQGVISKNVHNLISLGEIGKFCGRTGESPSKLEFLKLLDVVRSEHISLIYDAQDWKRIPQTLIEQADYVFLPYNIGLEDLVEIVKIVLPGEYTHPPTFRSKMAHFQGFMKKYRGGRRDWMVLDRNEKGKFFVVPVLPLSRFVEEKEG